MFRLTGNDVLLLHSSKKLSLSRLHSLFWLRVSCLLGATFLLVLVIMLSLSFGAKPIPFDTVLAALMGRCDTADCVIVSEARLPRTLIGILAGMALGLAGVLMQILTRNPLADPGILGVNSGAGFAVVLGITYFNANTISHYLGFAFAGALLASLLVALVSALSGRRLNPVRLTLAGVALAAVLEGMTSAIALFNPLVFDSLRFWQASSLDIQNMAIVHAVALPILLGTLITLLLGKTLNNLNMGNELATALGTRVIHSQLLGLLAITLLCGGATAAVGPIAFVGLMMPHITRRLAGAQLYWMLPWTLVLTPILLLTADLLGRFLLPSELPVSIVLSLIGAPVLIMLVRQHKIVRRGG